MLRRHAILFLAIASRAGRRRLRRRRGFIGGLQLRGAASLNGLEAARPEIGELEAHGFICEDHDGGNGDGGNWIGSTC